jgi:hypothetical protein
MTYEAGLGAEHMLTSLFQPDTLLSAQYFDTFRRKRRLEPEKRLMLAVLEDAIWCFEKYMLARDNKDKGLFRDVEDWILEEKGDWVFSFDNICEVAGFDPEYVRQGLMNLKEKRLAQSPRGKVRCSNSKKRKTRSLVILQERGA